MAEAESAVARVAERIATLDQLLDVAATTWPERPAVSDSWGGWTYRELLAAARRFEGWLRSRGIGPGDRVVVRAVADRRAVAAVYGCARAGAACVPINAQLKPVQIERILADSGASVAVADEWEAVSDTVDAHLFDHVWAADEGPVDEYGPPDPSDTALLIYTSGSTSPAPRAVVEPHAAVLYATELIARRLGYRAGDVVFCRLPLSFDYGLYQAFLCAYAGAELVLRGPEGDASLVADIRRTGATVVPLVPSLARLILPLMRRDPRPTVVRLFTNTGEDLPRDVIQRLREAFPGARVQLMFGTTECKRISIMEPDGDLTRPGSVGRPLDGTEVAIVDDAGVGVAPGVEGQIVVRGSHVMAGYWRAPDLTARVFRPDAGGTVVLYTGDYGYLDADGYLYFRGRRDHLFKLNGTRTSVVEVEAAAAEVAGVSEAAVLPPSDGHEAVLVVVSDLTPLEVLRELRNRLEAAKVPAACRVVAAMPHSANGKIDRGRLAVELGR